jgi:hypothetical protein
MKELRETPKRLNEKYGSEQAPIISHMHVAETADQAEKACKAFDVKTRED